MPDIPSSRRDRPLVDPAVAIETIAELEVTTTVAPLNDQVDAGGDEAIAEVVELPLAQRPVALDPAEESLSARLEELLSSPESPVDFLALAQPILDEVLGTTGEMELTRRVIECSLGIANELGLTPANLRVITLGAVFHDIGIAAVPEGVVNKPGQLSPEERRLVESHTEYGFAVAQRVKVLWEAASAIRHHHEWVDGSGYPDGLRGDEIPIEARVIAVADTFCAMTTRRPYREALEPDEALAVMRAEVDSHLDARCFDAFMRFHQKRQNGNVGVVVPFTSLPN